MKLLIAVALLCLPAAAQDSESKIELRWKWQKGQEYVYKSSQKTLMELGGMPMDQQIGYRYSFSIDEVSETGEATITVKYLSVVARGSGLAGDYEYDSEKDKEPPTDGQALMQAKMVGQSFKMKMTPAGRVTDVQGYDKVLEAITKGDADDPVQRAQFKQMFSNDTFKGMMQQMAPPLPEQKVAKGDTWSNDFTVKMPMIGAMVFATKSTLTELKDNNAHIDQDIKIELKGDDKGSPLAGLIELKDAKAKASTVYSAEKGCFLSHKSALEMKISVQGMEIPMKSSVDLTLVSRK